jgi:hypothetical protein
MRLNFELFGILNLKHIKVGDRLKKLLMVPLVILFMFFTVGCPDKAESKGDTEEKTKTKKIEVKSADLLMENYMRFLMIGNRGAMKSFYSAGLKKKLRIKASSADILPAGFSVGEADMMMEKANYKVNIYNSNRKGAYFSNDEFKYVVKIEGNKLVIDDISKEKSTELFKDGNYLFKRMDEKIKGDKIISLQDLPNYITAKEASAVEQKFPMPKKNFGPCALSPDGKVIVFSTTDKSSFLGILNENEEGSEQSSALTFPLTASTELQVKKAKIKSATATATATESRMNRANSTASLEVAAMAPASEPQMATTSTVEAGISVEPLAMSVLQQEGKDKQKSSGGQDQGAGGGNEQQNEGAGAGNDNSSKYKIKTVDLYFNSEIRNIAFSQDGKLFVVEYRPNPGLSKIAVYKSESGDKYALKSTQQFSASRFSFTNPYFASPKELVFTLIPTSIASATEVKSKGDWRLDLEKGTLRQF